MVRKLKIMEWNIHQQGRQYKNRRSRDGEIPLWILDEIPEDVNIVVFTEFNSHAQNIQQFDNLLIEKGFCFSRTNYSCAWANDILIAVRGEDIKIKSTSYVKAYSDMPNVTLNIDWDNIPENLRLDIRVGNKDIHLWGIRIKDLNSDYKKRKVEMETLMNWLQEIEDSCIMVGDFNNLRENTTERHWSLTILDKLLGSEFKRVTPESNHSWGVGWFKNDNFFDGYIKNDHLVCSNVIKAIAEPYKWDYLPRCNYNLEELNWGKQKLNIPLGEPDHGILIVEVQL